MVSRTVVGARRCRGGPGDGHVGDQRRVTSTMPRLASDVMMNLSAHRQRAGRCSVNCRAEVMIRPGIEK
jgi:hypothetical protein